MQVIKSLIMFIWAAWLKIVRGYSVWQWLKAGKPLRYAIIVGFCLALFWIIAALHPGNFSRAYAAYGGILIAMSLAWDWIIDYIKPEKYDMTGA